MHGVHDERTLTHLLDGMDHASEGDTVSVRHIIAEFGDRAITPFILLVALLLVSPLSGIPGTPTAAAIIIILLAAQALSGRRKLWLPQFLLRREMAGRRLRTCVRWLRKPCAFIDRHSHPRLQLLTVGPMRWLTLLVIVVIPLGWPALEVLPMLSSVGAGTVALLAFGLFTRDGLYVVLGYAMVLLTASIGYFMLF